MEIKKRKARSKRTVLGAIGRLIKLEGLKILVRRVGVSAIVVVLFISSLFVRAEPAPPMVHEIIYPQSCRGTWQGMNNIFTQELDARAQEKDFNTKNSAVPALGEPTIVAVPGKEEYNAFTVSLPILDQQPNAAPLIDQPPDTEQDLQLIIPPQEEPPVQNAPTENQSGENNNQNNSLDSTPEEQVLGSEDKTDDTSLPTDEQPATEKPNEEQEQPSPPPSQSLPQESPDIQLIVPDTAGSEQPATVDVPLVPIEPPVINFNNFLDRLINKALAEEEGIQSVEPYGVTPAAPSVSGSHRAEPRTVPPSGTGAGVDANASTADTKWVDTNSNEEGFTVGNIVESVVEKVGDIITDSAQTVIEVIEQIIPRPIDTSNSESAALEPETNTSDTPSPETKQEVEDSPSLLGTLFESVGEAISSITNLVAPLPPSAPEVPSYAIEDNSILQTENGTIACADFIQPASAQISQVSLGLSYTLKDQSPLPDDQSGFLWAEYTSDGQNWMVLNSLDGNNASGEPAYNLFNFPYDFDATRIGQTIVRLRWFGKYDEPAKPPDSTASREAFSGVYPVRELARDNRPRAREEPLAQIEPPDPAANREASSNGVYVDSLWLDVARTGDSEQEKPPELKTIKKDFGAFEEPVFNLSFDPAVPISANGGATIDNSQPQSIIEKYKERFKQWLESWAVSSIKYPLYLVLDYGTRVKSALAQSPSVDQAPPDNAAHWRETNLDISARLLTKDHQPTGIIPELLRLNSGQFKISLSSRTFRPGAYILETTIQKGDRAQTLEQDFTWGVLVVNTDQSVYKAGDEAELAFGVLDNNGNTVCGALLEVKITDPQNNITTLSTTDGSITQSGFCGYNNITDIPDYGAKYKTTVSGTYKLLVTADNGSGPKSIADEFLVLDDLPYRIKRIGASRVNPDGNYTMKIELTAENEFKGKLTEHVPQDITVLTSENQLFTLDWQGDIKAVAWNVDIGAGQTITLEYTYNVPHISPEIFKLGKITLTSDGADQFILQEHRYWLLASDAVSVTLLTSGGSNTDLSCPTTCTYTTASITPTANTLVLAWVASSSTNANLESPSLSGTGLTWVSVGSIQWGPTTGSPLRTLTLFRAMNSSPESGQVTITYTLNQTGALWSIVKYSGVDTSGSNGSGAVVQFKTGSADSAGTGGLTITLDSALGSPNNMTVGGFVNNINSADALTAGNGYTALTRAGTGFPTMSLRSEYKAAGSTTVDMAQESTSHIAGIAVEIKQVQVSITGTVYSDEGTTRLSGGPLVRIKVDGLGTTYTANANNTGCPSSPCGDYSISNVPAANASILMIYLDEATPNATVVTRASGSNLTGIDLYQDRVLLRTEDTGGATNATFDVYDGNDEGGGEGVDGDIGYTVTSSNLVVSNTRELHIAAGMLLWPLYGSVTLNSGGSGSGGDLHYLGNYTELTYNLSVGGGDMTGSGTITVVTTASVTLVGGGTFGGGTVSIVTTNIGTGSDSGTTTLASSTSMALGAVAITANRTLDTSGSNYNFSLTTLNINTSGTLNARGSTITFNGASAGTLFTRSGTFTAGTSTIAFNNTASATLTSGTFQTTNAFNNLSIGPASGTPTLTFGAGAITVNSNFDLNPTGGSTTLIVNMGAAITVTGTTTINTADTNSPTSTLDTTVSNYGLTTSTLAIKTGGTLTANASFIYIAGAGASFTKSGTFTYGTSTVNYTNSGSVTILSMNSASTTVDAYYSLWLNGTGSYSLGGAIKVNGDLVSIGGTLSGTSDVTVVGSATCFVFCGTITLTGGTFTQRVAAASKTFGTPTDTDDWTFYNLAFENSSGPQTIATNAGGSGQIIVSNTLTIGNATDSAVTTLDNDTANDRIINANGAVTITAKGELKASSSASFTIAGAFTLADNGTFTHSNGTITFDGTGDITLPGTPTAGITFYSVVINTGVARNLINDTTTAVMIVVNTLTINGTGSLASDVPVGDNNEQVKLTKDGGTPLTVGGATAVSGVAVLIYAPGGTATTVAGTTYNQLNISPTAATTLTLGQAVTTNSHLYIFATDGTSVATLDTSAASNYALTVTGNLYVGLLLGICFDGRLNLNASVTDVDGDVIICNESSDTLDAGSTANFNVGGNWTNGTNSVFTAGTSTVTFDAGDSGNTIDTGGDSFYDVKFNNTNGSWTIQTNAATVTNDLTMTAATQLNASVNVTVNGSVVGAAGVINITNAVTFEQRITSNKSFGPTTASTNWTFSTLIFSNGNGGATPITITAQSCSTCGVTVSSVLNVGKSGDVAGATTTLNAGDKTWTLSGTGGDPFQILASPAGDLTPSTSTLVYTGNNGGGNTTVQSETYNVLQVNNGSEIYALEGTTGGATVTITTGTLDTGANALTITGDFTVTGTLQGTGNVTANGNVTGAGTVTMTGGTFEQIVAADKTFGSSSGTNAWTFSGLKFNNSSGAAGRTITPNAGTGDIVVSGTLTLGDSGTQTITFDNNNTANDRVFDLNGALLISTQGSFTASNSVAFTVAGSFTNNGTFTHSSGTVTLDTTGTATLAGTGSPAITFYNLTSTTAGKTINFTAGQTFRINGKLTIAGTNGNPVNLHSTSSPTQWTINHQGTEDIVYADIDDSACDGSSTNISLNNTSTGTNDGACWLFPSLSFTIDDTSVDLSLTSGNNFTTTATNTLTVTARAEFGYNLTAYETGVLTHTAYPSKTIFDWSGTNAVPTTWTTTCIASSTCGFGYSTNDADLTQFSSTKYAGFTTTGPGEIVAKSTGPVTSDATIITYRSSVSAIQEAGPYQTTIIYIVTPQF